MRKVRTLRITRKREISFFGELLFDEATKERGDTRWWEVRIYRKTDDPNPDYVFGVGIVKKTTWRTERDKLYATETLKTKDEVIDYVNRIVPEMTERVSAVMNAPELVPLNEETVEV